MNKKKYQYGKPGRILSGKYKSWYILIEDYTSDHDGYEVFITSDKDISKSRQGYDHWFSDFLELDVNMKEHYPEVDWNI